MNEPRESSELNEVLLADIWRAFAIYDRSANAAQKRFMFLRLLILRLSVVVTFVAVAYSQIKTQPKELILSLDQYLPYFSIFHGLVNFALGIVVILAPIMVSILLAGTVKFGRGVNWILLRASAETIKQEIYLYRTQVGNYRDSTIRDINFAKEIQAINERLMKTQVNQSGLVWNEPKVNKRQSWLIGINQFWSKVLLRQLRKKRNKQFLVNKDFLAYRLTFLMFQEEQNKQSKEDKNALYSPLTAQQYIDERLMNQLNWYRKKTLDLDKKWQLWQWWIYLLGGMGTFLAAMKLDVWIAVTNAIAASILSFLEFRRLDSTLIGYNQTATNLENILWWWYALTDKDRTERKNVEKLVKSSEQVIRSETTGWVQEMKDAMADLYKIDGEAIKAEETEKNGDKKADGDGKSANLEAVPKEEGYEPNLSSIDN